MVDFLEVPVKNWQLVGLGEFSFHLQLYDPNRGCDKKNKVIGISVS